MNDKVNFIPPSQRPDGSWRPAIKVKPGYIPFEEMPRYVIPNKLKEKKVILNIFRNY